MNEMPNMLTGNELLTGLSCYPEYTVSIRKAPTVERLIALNTLYEVYYPFSMSVEIYSKLYLALLRSLQKKRTKQAVCQMNENRKATFGACAKGIIGGSDSFTILGRSGIGKSTAVARAVSLMQGDTVLEQQNPYCRLIPVLTVQCPFDSSVKGMLLEILRKVDETLDSSYYANALRAKATTDMLIGSVSTVCLNHIGLLVLDEVQNVAVSKNGKTLIGSLTQLINNSGISIAMVGTPESAPFFEQDYKLARRSIGLQYDNIQFDSSFVSFCQVLWRYQYTANAFPLSDGVIHWLYQHSNGITSNVISLIHDAQEISILDGTDTLGPDSLSKAYTQRMRLLHEYLENPALHLPTRLKEQECKDKRNPEPLPTSETADLSETGRGIFAKAAADAKKQGCGLITLLAGKIPITEVQLS